MTSLSRRSLLKTTILASGAAALASTVSANGTIPALTSWNDGNAKKSIIDFVSSVTSSGSADFVSPDERVAVFDNDGTLWTEQPMYVQLAFVLDRVKALAPEHPEWTATEPFTSVLSGDMKGIAASGEKGLLDLVAVTHAGMTSDEFTGIVSEWIKTARHPKFDRPYTSMIFQPMRELIDYLKDNGFKVFIVSGGGIEFMRPWAEEAYGIPPENVIGSSIKTKYEVRNGTPVIMRVPEIDFIDDKAGKPIGIHKFIGRRPTAAFGNSDGDFEMLEWTTSGPGKRFGLIVHHDDADREYAYGRDSHIGTLAKALDEAPTRGWTVVSMKSDWKDVFPA